MRASVPSKGKRVIYAFSQNDCHLSLHVTQDQMVALVFFPAALSRHLGRRWARTFRSLQRASALLVASQPPVAGLEAMRVQWVWKRENAEKLEQSARAVMKRCAEQLLAPLPRNKVMQKLGVTSDKLDTLGPAPMAVIQVQRYGRSFTIPAYHICAYLTLLDKAEREARDGA